MKIGFVGLGAMGGPMAVNLERAGHAVQTFDLNGKGNRKSAREASEGAEILFTSLPDGATTLNVMLASGNYTPYGLALLE